MSIKHEAEILAVMVVFCILWLVIPWEPLTAYEALWAVLAVVGLAWGIVAGAEHLIGEAKAWITR